MAPSSTASPGGRRALRVAAGVALALLLSEALLRTAGYTPAAREEARWEEVEAHPLLRRNRAHDVAELIPGASWVSEAGVEYRINSLGMRGPEPAPSGPRLLLLGDSVPFGSLVAQEETFAALLGEAGRSVLNGGVPGYALADYPRALRARDWHAWRPDGVLLCICLNDFPFVGAPAWWKECFGGSGWYGFLREVKRTVRPFEAREVQTNPISGLTRHRLLGDGHCRDTSMRHLDAVRRELEGAGIPWGVVVFPLDWQLTEPGPDLRYQAWVRAYARENGAPFLDLWDRFRGEADPRGLYLDVYHLSPRGHREAAQAIHAFADEVLSCEPPPLPSVGG